MYWVLLNLILANTPTEHNRARSLAQIEKQALEIQRIAQAIQAQARHTQEAKRPVGLAILQSQLVELNTHLKRLENALEELPKEEAAIKKP